MNDSSTLKVPMNQLNGAVNGLMDGPANKQMNEKKKINIRGAYKLQIRLFSRFILLNCNEVLTAKFVLLP